MKTMKTRSLLIMLLTGLLSVGMFVGCKNTASLEEETKTVEAKYRGIWKTEDSVYWIEITENYFKYWSGMTMETKPTWERNLHNLDQT